MPKVSANGIEVAYEERGAGDPLLLVPGLGMQLVAWPDGFLDALAAEGFRVIVMDNRDAGLSTSFDAHAAPRVMRVLRDVLLKRPLDLPYTIWDMAADAAGLLEALAIPRAHVIGISLGGMIAQAMAIAHGARLRSLTSIMSHSGGSLVTGRPVAMLNLLRSPGHTREEFVRAQLRFFRACGSTGFRRDDVDLARRVALQFDRAHDLRGIARQMGAAMALGDLRPALAAVKVPTLVLHGDADGIFRPTFGRQTAAAIPGARFHLIPGWGHDLAEGVWPHVLGPLTTHLKAA